MSTDEIKQIVEEAFSKGLSLVVKGYQSSKGAVYDYVIRELPEDGYHKLVAASLEALQKDEVTNPGDFENSVWEDAKAEKMLSFRKTLEGTQPKRAQHQELEHRKYYTTSPDKPGVVILSNLLEEDCNVVKTVESTTKSAPKTLAKKSIDSQLPLSKFVGRLNLAPDKVSSVSILA